MTQYICRVCEHDPVSPRICYLRVPYSPVGCPAVSQVGDPLPDAPMAKWLLVSGPVDADQLTLSEVVE